MRDIIYYSSRFVKWERRKNDMDPATLARHALEALKRPLTLKEALSSVADFRIDRRKKFPLCEILMIAVCAMIDGDRSRARREDLAENLAMLRHVVINVLRLDKSVFGGISVKRKELTWDDEKLLGLMLAA